EWRYKALGASSQCRGEYCLVNLWIEHYPEGLGEPDNGFDPGYQIVIKEGAGPPWRLAEHYEVAARARGAEPPEWVWEIGLWVTTYYSEGLPEGPHVRRLSIEELLEAIRLVREALGYPLALHCYSWFKGEFDANNPSYEPVEGARGYFESLRRLGVRIVPYVNARLWDIGWRWGEEPYKYAVKLAGPRLRPGAHALAYEIYPTSGQIHAVMCPAAEGWKRRILEIARTVKDLGADGVYLDQIAAAPPYLCLDAGHGHPRGGGGWWAKAYRELLAQIAEEGLLVVSELEAEAYVGALHGLLDWVSFASGFYPLHIALYGGKVVYLGRSFAMHEISNADLLAAKLGEQIAYGVQPGWIDVFRLAKAVERTEVLEVLRTYGEAYRHINWIFRAHKIDLGAVAQFDEKTFYLSIDPE
ncbi:MAG: hypothetical protein JZD41_03550, partial [Thermoproteus sp.]|nr:hypothetical protein [Thermoproteus sp.]